MTFDPAGRDPSRPAATNRFGLSLSDEAGERRRMSPDPRTGSSLSDVERRVAPSLFAIAVALPQDGVARLRGLVDSACLGRCPASDRDAWRYVA